MRADARANRVAILNAARLLYARNAEVPFSAIAQEAGVGIGTLYRHFPTPDELIVGLTRHISELVTEICHRRLPEIRDDPETGWTGYAQDIVGLRLGAIVPHLEHDWDLESLPPEVDQIRAETTDAFMSVVKAAQEAGLVRVDLAPLQVHLGLGVISRPLPASTLDLVPDLDDWLLEVYLRGLRP